MGRQDGHHDRQTRRHPAKPGPDEGEKIIRQLEPDGRPHQKDNRDRGQNPAGLNQTRNKNE
jgi:hypothetical protein